jgi:hypothetical protein
MRMGTPTALGLFSHQLDQGLWARKDLRHRHWETFYHDICVEWLQDILGHERVVDSGVFILAQLGQIALPDVDHGGRVSPGIRYHGGFSCYPLVSVI